MLEIVMQFCFENNQMGHTNLCYSAVVFLQMKSLSKID